MLMTNPRVEKLERCISGVLISMNAMQQLIILNHVQKQNLLCLTMAEKNG